MKKTDEQYIALIRIFTKDIGIDTPEKTNVICDKWRRDNKDAITGRKWRDIKDRFNDMYRNGESEWYICGFPNGYVLTQDKEKIKRDMRIKRRQALALLMRYSDTKTAMMLQHNFQADLDD